MLTIERGSGRVVDGVDSGEGEGDDIVGDRGDGMEGEEVEEVEGGDGEGLERGGIARDNGGGTDEVVGNRDKLLFVAVKWCYSLVLMTTMLENLWETTLTLPKLIYEWPK